MNTSVLNKKFSTALHDAIRVALAKSGLSVEQWNVLECLVKLGQMNASELSDLTGVMMPSLSRIKGIMAKAGWISQSIDVVDNRHTDIKITSNGRKMYHKYKTKVNKAMQVDSVELSAYRKGLNQYASNR